MRRSRKIQCVLVGACMLLSTVVRAQQAPAPVPLQATLDQAAASGTFTFVVFHRDGGDAGRTLTQQVAAEVQSHAEKATVATARVDDPAEKALVEKFGIARAPMPMVVVVAPNGAVTGLFPRAIKAEQVASAIVPPTMMKCMKALQDQKLV